MKALVIFAHPNPNSYNATILESVQDELKKLQVEVRVRDLYRMNWSPILDGSDLQQIHAGSVPEDIAKEQEEIKWADALICICPIWWTSVPAIMKGYIDRVMTYGFAYAFNENGMQGLMAGKRAMVITTSGSDEKSAVSSGMFELIRSSFVNAVFGFCGFAPVGYKNCYGVLDISDERRKEYLEEVKEFVRTNFA